MTNAPPEARWLAEIPEAAGYIFIVVLASFGSQGVKCLYAFLCPPEPRSQRTLSVAVTEAEVKREVGTHCEVLL